MQTIIYTYTDLDKKSACVKKKSLENGLRIHILSQNNRKLKEFIYYRSKVIAN